MAGGIEIELRAVGSRDDDFLYSVYASTRDDIAAVPWDDTTRTAFLRQQYQAQRSDYETRFPEAAHSVIVADDVDVGRIWINRQPDEIRLLDISVLPAHRNRGIGAELVGRLIAESSAREIPLRHSVYKDNESALRFYDRFGFEVIEDFGMYVLMEWSVSGSAATEPG